MDDTIEHREYRMDNYDNIDYSLWSVFKHVENSMLKNIVLLHIYGTRPESAIFVTRDDQVYSVGVNVVGSLGIGDIEETKTPIRLDLLCEKFVLGLASGSTHSIAYTKDGELYSWGDNSLGKLGNGTIISRYTPGRVLLPEKVKVIQAACADRYTAVITSENRVLHWGDIEWNSCSSQTLPIYLEFPGNVKIKSIECGALHAAALSNCGKVFTWGCNELFQLGRGGVHDIELSPKLVGVMDGNSIKQIACSITTTIALTDDGLVFAWGDLVKRPLNIPIDGEMKCVAAANTGFVAVAYNDFYRIVYKWELKDLNYDSFLSKPFNIQVDNVLNAFAFNPTPKWKRLMDHKDDYQFDLKDNHDNVSRDIGITLYNNKEYSDLVLRLSDGVIYVQKLILRAFCEHFKSMLDGHWVENEKKEIDMTSYNPDAYRAFVKFIYTGKLEHTLNGMQLIELCDIAESYFEKHLKFMAIAKFSHCLTVENVAELYCTASLHSCEELKEMCCNFASTRLEEVILSDGFDNIKSDLCKSLVRRAAQIKNNVR